MSKKVKVKMKRSKMKIKLKSGDRSLPLSTGELRSLLGIPHTHTELLLKNQPSDEVRSKPVSEGPSNSPIGPK